MEMDRRQMGGVSDLSTATQFGTACLVPNVSGGHPLACELQRLRRLIM